MSSSQLNMSEKHPDSANLMLRLMLRQDEVFRLPEGSRGVQVVSGAAWLTVAGKDVFLKNGERLWLAAAKDLTLISALGCLPLILEVWGNKTSSSTGLFTTPAQSRPKTI